MRDEVSAFHDRAARDNDSSSDADARSSRTGLSLSVSEELFDALVEAVSARLVVPDHRSVDGEQWPEWMSVDTAARYLDISPHRLRKLQARREVPFHQEAPGCRVLFRRCDLDDWLTEMRHPVRPQRQERDAA